MDDILQKAILDVNRMHEVAIKAAEKSVYHKFSKEVKKRYVENLSEMNDDTFQVDDEMLQEYDLPLDEEEQNPDLNEPQSSTAGNQGEDPLSGLGGGDQAGGEMPLGGDGNIGGSENSGLAPQEPQSEVVDELPGSWEDGTGSVTITFDNFGVDQPEEGNFDSNVANAHEDTNNFLSQENTLNTEPADGGVNDINFEDPNQEQEQLQNPNEEVNPFENPNENVFGEDIFKVSDNILLEYIEKSVENDKRIDLLSETIQSLQTIVEKLSEQLEKSNKNMESLKEQNIRLMYKNQALNDDSLSEHQKENIVKALDRAKTLNEAKTIYETAKVSNTKNNSSKEAINKVLTPNGGKKFIAESKINENKNVLRNEESVKMPPILDKLYNLWGIK